MGEARLKKEKPQHRAGPHGHDYYCRNRCGRVAFTKTVNQTFIERNVRHWGWCKQCRDDDFAMEGLHYIDKVCNESPSQDEALKTIKLGVRMSDGKIYDLSTPLLQYPKFLALPTVLAQDRPPERCNALFRHGPHDLCDGNPEGLIDPVFGVGPRS